MIAYYVIDRVLTIAWIGRTMELTPAFAVTSLFTGALLVAGVVELAS